MKKLVKVVVLISFIVLSGCNSTKELKSPKGAEINMTIKNLEELLASRELVLPKGKINDKNHVWYLEDGTKIEFHGYKYINGNSSTTFENIYSNKYPFVKFRKSYFTKSNIIEAESQSIKGVFIGVSKIYNEQGKLIQTFDDSERQGYKNILSWAEKQGFINLSRVEILEGKDFELWYEEFKPNSYEENYKKYLEKYKNRELVIEMLKHKAFWTYTIYYEYEFRKFILSDNGVLIYDEGKKRIPASGTEI